MRGFIVYQTYRIEHGKAYVYLFGRLENGKSFCTVNHYRPYFTIEKENVAKVTKLPSTIKFDTEETTWKTMQEHPVSKVVYDIPRDTRTLRKLFEENKIKCYEADIRFTQRFLMDMGIKRSLKIEGAYEEGETVDRIYKEPKLLQDDFYPNFKILSFDIETSRDAKEVYSISMVVPGEKNEVLIVSDKELKNAKSFPDEKSMLEHFKQQVLELDPDIITGWNMIDFDLQVLRDKFRKHNIPFRLGRWDWDCTLRIESSFLRQSTADFPGRQMLDGIQLLKLNFVTLDNYKLGTAAHELLGEKKLIGDGDKINEIETAYEKHQQKLVDYNLKDSQLVLDILEKTNAIEIMINRAMLTGMPLDRVRGSIASFDSLYLRELRKRKYVAPCSGFSEKDEQIVGGYVMQSVPGMYDYVVVCDFKSLYPSLMRTFNIDPLAYEQGKDAKSPDNKDKWITAPNGAVFAANEGILPDMLQQLWTARDEAKKKKDDRASFAIKILMNSFFGVLASPACRFYSLEIGNAITSFARHFIQMTIDTVGEKGYSAIYGDSITAERPIVIRGNGKIDIVPVELLFRRYANRAKVHRGKERIDLRACNIETLSVNPKTGQSCFKRIDEIIRHHTNKKVFRVNQKYGETRCTEDHSLILAENYREVEPQNLKNRPIASAAALPDIERVSAIDLYELLKGRVTTQVYKGKWKIGRVHHDNTHIWFGWMNRKNPVKLKRHIQFPSDEGDALLRLLGFYVAEGSSSTQETTETRFGASIATQEREILEQMKNDYELLFVNSSPTIIQSDPQPLRELTYSTSSGIVTTLYNDTTLKLNFMNALSAIFFQQLCGQKSTGKKLPSFLFHLPRKEQQLLLEYMILGDGSRERNLAYSSIYRKHHFRYTTKSLLLMAGLSFLCKQLGYCVSIRYRKEKKAYTLTTLSKNNANITTKVIEENYTGYVYDLSIPETQIFADACGQIFLHNTDSVFIDVQSDSYEDSEKTGKKISKEINSIYDEHIKTKYHRDSFLELEVDKVFIHFIMPRVRGSEKGAKKRYAGIVLKDGKEKLEVTGMEIVRRDWTDLAKEFQAHLLEMVFKKKDPSNFIKEYVEKLRKGKLDDKLVYKKAIRKELASYTKTTPPHVKAARLVEEKGKKLDSSVVQYILTTEGPYPLQLDDRPAIDYDHYAEKQLKPIADAILIFFDTTFEDALEGQKQTTLGGY